MHYTCNLLLNDGRAYINVDKAHFSRRLYVGYLPHIYMYGGM